MIDLQINQMIQNNRMQSTPLFWIIEELTLLSNLLTHFCLTGRLKLGSLKSTRKKHGKIKGAAVAYLTLS